MKTLTAQQQIVQLCTGKPNGVPFSFYVKHRSISRTRAVLSGDTLEIDPRGHVAACDIVFVLWRDGSYTVECVSHFEAPKVILESGAVDAADIVGWAPVSALGRRFNLRYAEPQCIPHGRLRHAG